ncbi:hypothetical protein [Corynebacterium ulceribovis]|uniref:hypothetical protein n=1 Tax=Corynebacterium ulceribovis TaxID=487732 RepID=UPI000369F2F0|nr:hypothetical protein [Corynebacterium ulceribovis]
MTANYPPVTTPWGTFHRATALFDGLVQAYDFYQADAEPGGAAEPELYIFAESTEEATATAKFLDAFFNNEATWRQRAVTAIVSPDGAEAPTPEQLESAMDDLALTEVEAHPEGAVVLNFEDRSEFGVDGYWFSVRFDQAGKVQEVTFEH